MNILFIGDIFGSPGRKIVKQRLSEIRKKFNIECTIANCENLASGRGVTENTIKEMLTAGVNVFTGGNHLWDRRESLEIIEREQKIVRPYNCPPDAIGNPVYYLKTNYDKELAVINLVGQAFMSPADSPIQTLRRVLPDILIRTNLIFLDFHAESTAEKRALAYYFDGQISVVAGTHTHIQTADEEILPGGTAYITDVGMTGPHDSIIGVKKDIIFYKLLTGQPIHYEVAEEGIQLNAVVIEVDTKSGKSIQITRIKEKF